MQEDTDTIIYSTLNIYDNNFNKCSLFPLVYLQQRITQTEDNQVAEGCLSGSLEQIEKAVLEPNT